MAEATSRTAVERTRRSPRIFFGWWIIAAGAGLQMMQAMFLGQAYGAYVVLLREEFGWSKTMLSAASSLREAESGILGPIHGWMLDRMGPRAVARIGVVILGIGFMLFSQVNSPLTFYGAFLVMSVGGSMAGYMTVTFAAVHWFERRRATAISLTSTGFALGGMAVPITVLLLEWLGWRGTAFLSGVLIMAIGLPLTQVLRHHPHDYGLHPDGDRPDDTGHASMKAVPRSTAGDFTLGEAVRQPAFWWISLGHASALFVVSSMGVHLISHLRESQGYSLGQASTIVFLLTLLFMTGNISGGFLGDRVNKRVLLVACMGMHSAGLLILSHASNVWMVVAFTLIHGLAWGWRGPQMAAIRADYFGRSSFGKIMGVSNMIIIIGTISGPLIAGYMYDRTGNYRLGFDILAGIALAGSVFFILARRPAHPRRAASEPRG
ncbi:MAG: MFS transporter [Dehalococcoidia bacterium]|nr:MFS transporter [Dehalococcoidia bacterium]